MPRIIDVGTKSAIVRRDEVICAECGVLITTLQSPRAVYYIAPLIDSHQCLPLPPA